MVNTSILLQFKVLLTIVVGKIRKLDAWNINDHISCILVLRNDDWCVCLGRDYCLAHITKAAMIVVSVGVVV